jgi:general secretion pathway protein A
MTATQAKESPFSISPDPTALFLTPALKTTIYKTRYTVETRQGLAVLLGDNGLGKSTVMRYIFSKLSAMPEYTATFIPTPSYRSSFTMLQKICGDFGIPPARSELKQQEAFERFLGEEFAAGRHVLVFIDEAQRLKPDQLELVRVWLNFETTKIKLISLVLAGQLDLRDRLLTKKYKPLLSRIFSPCMLVPLEFNEMVEMLKARCDKESRPWPFSPDPVPLRDLYEFSGGVPRSALKACQMAYGMMIELGESSISADLMREVLKGSQIDDTEAESSE